MAQLASFAESPVDENILYAGSGDGLIHYSHDGGKSWTKCRAVKGLPEYARVHQIIASNFDRLTAYTACHNLVDGDYRPYLYKTIDGGKNWDVINSNLPENGCTYTIAEDHVDKDLLFAEPVRNLFQQ